MVPLFCVIDISGSEFLGVVQSLPSLESPVDKFSE